MKNNFYYKLLRLPKVLKQKDTYFRIDKKLKKTSLGEGLNAWTIVAGQLNAASVVYSFGVGTDISFDLALIANNGCTVHAFDPTPKSVAWVAEQQVPAEFVLHEQGLANFDGQATFNPPPNEAHVSATMLSRPETADKAYNVEVCRLSTIMQQLGHKHIDLLKMDIEGAEYDVIDDILKAEISVNQILIEFHHRFANVGLQKTKDAVNKLRQAGYKLFNVSAIGEEFSFVKSGTSIS